VAVAKALVWALTRLLAATPRRVAAALRPLMAMEPIEVMPP